MILSIAKNYFKYHKSFFLFCVGDNVKGFIEIKNDYNYVCFIVFWPR